MKALVPRPVIRKNEDIWRDTLTNMYINTGNDSESREVSFRLFSKYMVVF